MWVFLIILVGLALNVCQAMEFNNIADMKGHTEARYFWWSLLLGPIGWFMVIALPDRSNVAYVKKQKKSKGVKRAEEGSVPDEEIIAELMNYQSENEE